MWWPTSSCRGQGCAEQQGEALRYAVPAVGQRDVAQLGSARDEPPASAASCSAVRGEQRCPSCGGLQRPTKSGTTYVALGRHSVGRRSCHLATNGKWRRTNKKNLGLRTMVRRTAS